MTTLEIARRLDARPFGNRWQARCPGHPDRRPSLSVREGRGGKTLLHCFAGCTAEVIIAAIGLGLSDLFADSTVPASGPVRSSIESAQAALDGELVAVLDREEQRLGFRPAATTRLKNEARAEIERRFGVRLTRHVSPWWEISPYAEDPQWRAFVGRAIDEAAWHDDSDPEAFRPTVATMPDRHDEILRRARELQRELAAAS